MDRSPDDDARDQEQTAELELRAGGFSAHLKVRATPAGLLAVGGLVGCILLSVTALVWSATSVKRKHPVATLLGER